MKRISWFETILIVVIMSISLYAALSDAQNLSQRWFTRDDAYYYFKVAQNISEGHGSTFDGINPTNGYHPLWMAICVPIFALARFDLVLPLRILLLVMSGLSVATGILLYRLLGKVFAPFIGALAALYWVFSPHVFGVVYQQGLETGIAAFFIVLLLYKLYEFEGSWRKNTVSKKQLITLGMIAALAMFSRLDLVFLAGMAGLWIVFRGYTLRYYLPLDIISIILSVLLAFVLKFNFPGYYEHSGTAVTMIGVALIVRLPTAYFLGLHQNLSSEKLLKILSKSAIFTLISSAIVSAIMLFLAKRLGFDAMPRIILAMDGLFSFLLIGTTRFLHKGLYTKTAEPKTDSPLKTLQAKWKQWLNEGMIYYSIVFGLLGVYMTWNKIAFGTSSPVSGQIKRWWGSFITNIYGTAAKDKLTFFGINYKNNKGPWEPLAGVFETWAKNLGNIGINGNWGFIIIVILFSIICYLILRANKQKAKIAIMKLGIISLFCSAILQIFGYHITGYSAEQNWYWTSQLIVIVLVMSILIGMASQLIPPSRLKQAIGWGIVAIAGIQMGISFWSNVRTTMPYKYWSPDSPFVEIIPVIEANTEPGSIIGFTGGGDVGYFIRDRTIINMDGLINSQPYFQALKNGTAGEYLNDLGLDYVFANPIMLESRPYKGQFNPYLEATGIISGDKELMKFSAPQ